MAVSPRISEGSTKTTTKEIREWATAEGREVSSRGRIPAEIVQAFHDAQAAKVQAEPAPAKKTAATKKTVKKAAAKKTAATKTAGKKIVAKKAAVEKPVAEAVPVKRAVVSKAPAKKSSTEIREWALGAGHKVSPR
ncbi:MAG: histone-like nucleoid-structuring protein Lsr2, partial [Rhodococcus sp. (in: high G+C Gram-positive bacteria)]